MIPPKQQISQSIFSGAAFPVLAAFVFAVALFFGSVFLLDLNLSRLSDSFAWVQHTDDVLTELAQIDLDIVDAESGERGYLLTGDDFYLGSYAKAQAAAGPDLARLERLVSDNPAQTGRASVLRSVVEKRMAEFKKAVDLGPSRLKEALAVIRNAKAQQLTRRARDQIEIMRQDELRLLADRQSTVHSEAAQSTLSTLGAAVLGLASAALGLVLFMRQRHRSRMDVVQTELFHLSRLNTMGQTTSALAHEIKQPLTATRGYLDAVTFMLEAEENERLSDARQALEKAAAQVDRAAGIISRLRNYVELHETDIRPENVPAIIEDAVALMSFRDSEVTVRTGIEPALPEVLVDRVEVEQVLINLMRNAVEAMSECPRRELDISAELLKGQKPFARVSVADTGPGLSREIADRLFQPFNSTKPDGMGVGLSISRSLIERFGGRIWADPNPEGGTIFRFTMPAAQPSSSEI